MITEMKNHEAIITEFWINDAGIYARATCGKIPAGVCITEDGIQVIPQNTSLKVFRKAGRHFESAAEAIAAIDRRNS